MKKVVLSCLLWLFLCVVGKADKMPVLVFNDTVPVYRISSISAENLVLCDPAGISANYPIPEQTKKKLISAMLAFPFPFGFMGAHRVMLGCKPWIPVVYVATFGGCFGLLPMIDFIAIVCSKDITQYENNPRVFMWLK